jgi:integron integrase
MHDRVRLRNYSPNTLRTYLHWTRRFQAFVRSKPPEDLGPEDVKSFLTDLAVEKNVAASTQNQAFNALLFFFRHGLGKEFGQLDGVVRAKRRPYIPVVLSRREVDAVIAELEPPHDLIVKLLYGCGLRISECTELRVHCLNLDDRLVTVHDGKGQKDRTVPLPETAMPELESHLKRLGELHRADMATEGWAGVFLPRQFERKSRRAAREFIWQWLFPAPRLTRVDGPDELRRYHVQRSHVHRAIKEAAATAGLTKRVTAHTFRHSFASHLLQANYDIVTIQRLLGHSSVKTTMIYTQTVPSVTLKDAKSPLDL